MLFVSLALVAAGIGLGCLDLSQRRRDMTRSRRRSPALFRFLENKMWLDELYAKTVIALRAMLSARCSDLMDRYFWDGLVRVVGGIGQLLGILTKGFDERGINAGVDDSDRPAHAALGRVMSRAALGTNPNLSGRHRRRHAGAAYSLRMARHDHSADSHSVRRSALS